MPASLTSFQVAVATQCAGDPPTLPAAFIEFTPSSPLVIPCAAGSTGVTNISGAPGPFTAVPFAGMSAALTGTPPTNNVLTITRSTAVLAGSASIPVIVSNGTVSGTIVVAPPAVCGP